MTRAFSYTKDGSEIWTEASILKLPSSKFVYVPPLCMANIQHGISIKLHTNSPIVFIVRDPRAFSELNLLVDTGPVEDGEVITHVLNLCNKTVRIRARDIVSWL